MTDIEIATTIGFLVGVGTLFACIIITDYVDKILDYRKKK